MDKVNRSKVKTSTLREPVGYQPAFRGKIADLGETLCPAIRMSQLFVVSCRWQEKRITYGAELKADDEMIITRYVPYPWHFAVNEVKPQRTTDPP